MNRIFKHKFLLIFFFSGLICLPSLLTSQVKRQVAQVVPPLKTDLVVHFLNKNTLLMVGDYNAVMKKRILKECDSYLKATANNIWWSYEFSRDFAALEVVNAYRPKISKRFATKTTFSITNNKVRDVSYWMNAIGKMRLKDPYKENHQIELLHGVEVAHFSYLHLEEPLLQNKKYTITSEVGETLSFTYDENKIISRTIKVNQLGYHPNAGQKYAYLGMWLGMKNKKSQTLNLAPWLGKKFTLIDEHGKVSFTGVIEFRMNDQRDNKGFPITGETVYQLDFSSFSKPGTYHIHIDGIGNSWPFKINNHAIFEAFYTHARGLYHKRCGIAKKSPYTHWHMGKCHSKTFRGGHLSNVDQYKEIIKNGKKIELASFEMITQTKTNEELKGVFGGWHDAADYDRRPMHFNIVQDLITPYLMAPKKFSDGQLNIPESGNGIPDILDEADWGMRVWLRAQNKNGSVGTWIEATSHPKQQNPSKDPQPYFISLPTRASTMQYAAYAALMSHAYKISGHSTRSTEYKESAIKAFNWAIVPQNRVNKKWQVKYYTNAQNKRFETSKYTQEQAHQKGLKTQYDLYSYTEGLLKSEPTFKAALNLFMLTDDPHYSRFMKTHKKAFSHAANNIKWYASSFLFAEILTFNKPILIPYQQQLSRAALKDANNSLQEMNSYAYRNPWYPVNTGHYTKMGWGTWHPLRQAKKFVLAHYISNNEKYKNAAFLCNDFQLGCNAMGRSMTSGLGSIYPVKFLDLISYSDEHEEFVPGITPYLLTYGIYHNVKKLAFNLKVDSRADHNFSGLNTSILGDVDQVLPIYRRFGNLEGLSVPQDEYTVHETIGPAVAVTAYLIDKDMKPSQELKNKRPKKFTELKGLVPTP